jgi:hypothetical protein
MLWRSIQATSPEISTSTADKTYLPRLAPLCLDTAPPARDHHRGSLHFARTMSARLYRPSATTEDPGKLHSAARGSGDVAKLAREQIMERIDLLTIIQKTLESRAEIGAKDEPVAERVGLPSPKRRMLENRCKTRMPEKRARVL